jgi:serine protease Do
MDRRYETEDIRMRKRGRFLFSLALSVMAVLALTGVGCAVTIVQTPTVQPPVQTANKYVTGESINASWVPPWTVPVSSNVPTMSIPDIVKEITPSVVAVHTEVTAYDIFLQPIPSQGVGTGIIIDGNGYIVTNNHVIDGAKSVTVITNDGRSYDAVKVNGDPFTDLAVIQIDAKNLPIAEIWSSRTLLVGEGVVAVGNALALEGGPTVTSGIVSYIGRSIMEPNGNVLNDLIQTDAAINPGNSGGPLLNMEGQVIGINTAVASQAENIGFAIAITPALPVIEQLIHQGRVIRPYLGVGLYTTTNGVVVTSVDSGSPADKAGLEVGDVITQFAGQKVTTAGELRQAITSAHIGDKVEIDFVRNGKANKTFATLVASPS